jgi:hypothetical protein
MKNYATSSIGKAYLYRTMTDMKVETDIITINLAGRSRDITPELKNLKSKGKLGLLFMIPPGLISNNDRYEGRNRYYR